MTETENVNDLETTADENMEEDIEKLEKELSSEIAVILSCSRT